MSVIVSIDYWTKGEYMPDMGVLQESRLSKLDMMKFSTVGYFIESYFNWSRDWAELEECIEEFLHEENKKNTEALRKEVEILYKSHDPELIRSVSYKLGGRGMPTEKASSMIELLYAKTR